VSGDDAVAGNEFTARKIHMSHIPFRALSRTSVEQLGLHLYKLAVF
jgi:hypothetical protein